MPGKKAITCSLIDEAWNAQTYDWFPPMIEWVKAKKRNHALELRQF